MTKVNKECVMANQSVVALTAGARRLLVLAFEKASGARPDTRHLLLAFLERHAEMLRQINPQIDPDALLQAVAQELAQGDTTYALPLEAVLLKALQIANSESENEIDSVHIGKALLALREAPPEAPRPVSVLQMGLNLNDLARAGAFPQVVGRDEEIDQVVEVLCRPINPYAVLVGLEGVGRRAVVQGLAQRIVEGKVPEPLRERPVIVFPQVLDDPRFYGALIEESARANAILYIEPFESFLSAPAPPIDLLRLSFLSELVIRRVPVIGAISSIEVFRRHIARAPDLLKRFQPISIHPLTAEETLMVLQQISETFAQQFGVTCTPEALALMVRIADENIHHRPFPDKAILLLDHAVGRARSKGLTTVEPRMIWESASLVTGLPIGEGERSMVQRIEGLADYLKSRVIGQDEAIDTLVQVFALKIRRLDIRPERPNGIFLFVGPTGVGKTETARAIAEYFFGSKEKMLRLDMNQFYSEHTAARLLGAEFGYVGFEMGAPLLDFVAENPFCVVLLDEIEKAHESIHKLFLQIFDDGSITDAQGRRVSFSDAIIIMTSNLQPEQAMGFLRGRPTLEDWRRVFSDQFAPEFINRVDAICVFQPLQKPHIRQIVADRFIKNITEVYRHRRIELIVDDSAIDWLTELGYHERYGARELERVVERNLLLLIAPEVPTALETVEMPMRTLRVSVQDNKLVVNQE